VGTIIKGIEATEAIPGRCERLDEAQRFAVVVDAAPTPASLGMLLDGLREAGAKRVITVLGADGGAPAAGRALLGEMAHFKSDVVIVANANPRGEDPQALAADVCAGFPSRLLARNARTAYPPGFLQDPGRVSSTVLEFLWSACWQEQRYVCEDRWMAVRWAVGSAGQDDAVVLAGKGAQDYAEWAAADGTPMRGWFDDRVEGRAALAKAHHLWGVTDLDRRELPWVEWDERETREEEGMRL
jgi:UDP-N-acetylmuramyl tripeptide synthase